MGLSAEDLARIIKLTALVQQGILELNNIIQNKHQQAGKTDEEILDHAEKANAEAKALIENLW